MSKFKNYFQFFEILRVAASARPVPDPSASSKKSGETPEESSSAPAETNGTSETPAETTEE